MDIDNVINDLGPLLKSKAEEHFGQIYTLSDIYKNYHLRDSLNITRLEEIRFWQKYGIEIAQNCEPRKYCRQSLLWLRNHGFAIQLITARPILMKPMTQSWLEKHQIPYDGISYGVDSKGEECGKQQIQFMVEDADHNIIDLLQKNIAVIAFPYPYNMYIRHKKLIHLNDWREVAYFLAKRKKRFKGA